MSRKLLLLLLVSFNLSAQEIISEFQAPRDEFTKKTDLIVFSKFGDSSKKIFMALTGQKIKSYQLDSAFKPVPNQDCFLPTVLSSLDPIGGFYSENLVTLLYSKRNKKEFTALNINLEDHSVAYSSFKLPKNEIFLESFSTGDFYYVVALDLAKLFLVFYKTGMGKNFETNTVDLSSYSFGPFKYRIYENLKNENGKLNLSMISYESISSLAQTFHPNKGYVSNGKFFLTIDRWFGATTVIQVDLKSWKAKIETFGESTKNCGKYSAGSFLYHENIFVSQVCDDRLAISVFNINSGLLLKEYSVLANEDIAFKNTPIIQEGGNFFAGDIRELGQTKALLRKILRSQLAIAVNATNSGLLELTVGSFVEFQRGGVPGSAFVPGVTVPGAFGVGTVTLPPTYNPTYSSYQSYKVTKSASFKSLLNSTSLDHIKGKIDKNDFDKMEDYFEKEGSTIPVLGIKSSDVLTKTIFYDKGRFYAVFYSKEKESFIVLKP